MKRNLFHILQVAVLGGAAAVLADPTAVAALVPIQQQGKVASILAIAGALLPSILPQRTKTALWGSVPQPKGEGEGEGLTPRPEDQVKHQHGSNGVDLTP